MCDKLVFDLAQEVEGTPNVFVRKDWINILDNQNQNYSNNQSVIDTSQLSNSNKYMSYRESYLSIPMTLTLQQTTINIGNTTPATDGTQVAPALGMIAPANQISSLDSACGLKNWFGNIIHSLTLDYNGTTTIQQTPYANMWNAFKLMTSLSLQDIKSQGATIGFYPDNALTWGFYPGGAGNGLNSVAMNVAGDSLFGDGTCNNNSVFVLDYLYNASNGITPNTSFTSQSGLQNEGLAFRQSLINFDVDAVAGNIAPGANGQGVPYSAISTADQTKQLWKSFITAKVNSASTVAFVANTAQAPTTPGYIQYSIIATVYLKHIHSFFNMCPLLKGVFMKLTLNLNNASSTIVTTASAAAAGLTTATGLHLQQVSVPIGGVNPLMISGANWGTANAVPLLTATAAGTARSTFVANISVGATALDNNFSSAARTNGGLLSKSIYLYTPAYTFNPIFEQAYLSNPVKQIKYTDIYQYQVINVASAGTFNNLITNGIANIKSVLIIPYFSPSVSTANAPNTKSGLTTTQNTGLVSGVPVWQSPFDPAGCGCTSPLVGLTNFNVQISGQNAIYNLQKYSFEEYNNQFYGQNAVNGGLTDGLTSGLISRMDFDNEYCFYYVNVERMLPVEMSVPKSVQIIGQNQTQKALDLYVFIEYGVEISIDALTGARV